MSNQQLKTFFYELDLCARFHFLLLHHLLIRVLFVFWLVASEHAVWPCGSLSLHLYECCLCYMQLSFKVDWPVEVLLVSVFEMTWWVAFDCFGADQPFSDEEKREVKENKEVVTDRTTSCQAPGTCSDIYQRGFTPIRDLTVKRWAECTCGPCVELVAYHHWSFIYL